MKSVESVCIVDDDKIYRYTTERYIQSLKLASRVLAYADGEEAIQFIRENRDNKKELPEIILLDVNMPIMDGWEFMEEFSRMAPGLAKDITIYMVSSSIDSRDRERARQIEMISDFFVKPISEDQLTDLISRAV